MMDERLIMDLADRIRGRFYGKYRGVVTQVDGSTMRVKAKVPAVLTDTESGWAMPCVPYAGDQVGIAFLPETGSGVWIEFEGGDVSFPIWTGCYWHSGEQPSQATADAKTIITKQTTIVFDDSQSTGNWTDSNQNTVQLDSSGITLTQGSSSVAIGTSSVSVNDGSLEVQ